MEKVKNFLKANINETIFVLGFILLLGFFALPFLTIEIWDGVIPSDGEVAYIATNLSIYQLIAGGKFQGVDFMPDGTFILILIMVLLSGIGVISTLINKNKKTNNVINGVVIVLLLTVAILLIASEKFIGTYDYLRWTYDFESIDHVDFNTLGFAFTLIALIIMFITCGLTLFKNVKFSVQDIVEMSMLVAVALILDKIKIPLPMAVTGGSINLAGLALMLLSLRHGPLKGFIGGSIIFGLISCLIDGYGLQTFPFDYFIAFSGYLIPGLVYNLFKATVLKGNENKNKDLGYLIASLVIGCIGVIVTRMIGSSISSYVYFVSYLDDSLIEMCGGSTFLAILLYNISYIGPSGALSLVGAILLAKPLQIINGIYPVGRNKYVSQEETTQE